jgi:hypothetical protein
VSCVLLLPGGDLLLGCRAGEVILVSEDPRQRSFYRRSKVQKNEIKVVLVE